MLRRILLSTALAIGAASLALANQNATLVLRGGERVSGELNYGGGADIKVNDRTVPLDDVAIVAFVPGDPSVNELNQVAPNDNVPEHERDLVVLRNGQTIRGKLYKFSPTGDSITVDTQAGQRQDFSSNDVARLYIRSAARQVYANLLNGSPNAPNTAVATTGALGSTITVNANQPWTDTGITVRKGDRLRFPTTGQVQISPTAPQAGPDGTPGDTAPRTSYPIAGMPGGGLIGRVGNSTPFPIGSTGIPITMPANGRLYLGINDSIFTDNTGAFRVTVTQ